ncbi:MAG: phosphoribosylanthranilate isomerase [Candidatus Electronema aureum]|uniref:N-(5'-phosphoribosyl)anthranilate isomerase n=1 Tax=Candidatus Electronema aureum TaxID=2005002 RepID=A0A521FZ52_9BACT|nr:MAG: phosphoribosylanthranilate isomerase [Candidatus Electronema aureum]
MSMRRIRIKMCGTKKLEDALAAVEAGIDALGFIFHKKSPRYVEPETAWIIIKQLPPFVDTVGVFVDRDREEVEEIIRFCSLNYVQLHGQESPDYCEKLSHSAAPCRIIKALRVGAQLRAEDVAPYSEYVQGFLLDTYQKGQEGGTGQTFDWSLIKPLRLQRDFILAGGLDANNVCKALEAARPYAVDVNSGVEISPGCKDHQRIRDFVRQVRQIEQGG